MWNQKLTNHQRLQIKRSGKTSKELADKFKVSITYINVLRRQSVKELTLPYDGEYTPNNFTFKRIKD